MDKQGKIIGFSGVSRDITDRRQAQEALQRAHNELKGRVEERTAELLVANEQLRAEIEERKQALRESEERFKEMAELLPTIIIELNINFNLTYVNQSAFHTFGYSQADLEEGLSVVDMINSDDRKRALRNIKKVIKGKRLHGNEYRMLKKDGSELTMFVESMPIYKKGRTVGIRSTLTDVTDSKRAEESLRESEEKYRTIPESIEDGYFEVDIRGNFTFFNDSLCKILGYPKDELMGMNNRQYVDQENAKKVYQTFNKVYTTGKSDKGFDWELIRKDGTKR